MPEDGADVKVADLLALKNGRDEPCDDPDGLEDEGEAVDRVSKEELDSAVCEEENLEADVEAPTLMLDGDSEVLTVLEVWLVV